MSKKQESKVRKDSSITVRINPQWEDYIQQTADALSVKMETIITKTWVVTQLMKMGLPSFEKKFSIRRTEKRPDKKTA